MNEIEAREVLRNNNIEMGPDDPRGVVEIATALLKMGTPKLMIDGQLEIIQVEESTQ
ncbi:MAG: hypothetical protein AAB459_00585 [Patescibacteria group bacterium]